MAFKALRGQGLTQEQAAKALGMHPGSGVRIEARIKEELGLTNGLLSPQRDEMAGKVLDHLLQKGSKLKAVKGSDALGAVKVYADRRWPAKNDQVPASISFVEINIGEVKIDPSNPQSIDITPDNGQGTSG